ncbi:MAG: hypothetical protein IJB75_04765 [Oscillospiraceae bacterium]|nr:hypothetical protein [Oscillospiraceae bacterium]
MTFELDGGGHLDINEEGGFVRCEATRPNDGQGIYKVWLTGAGGTLLLGTLAPERGALRLCRKLSRNSLARAGCWPVEGGRCVLAVSFQISGWVREAADRRMTDPVLRQAARGKSALAMGKDEGFRLAFPFHTARPFDLTPAFCFARVERVEGRVCAVFSFDGQGRLRGEE